MFGSNVHLPCGDIDLGCTIYGVDGAANGR